MSIPNPDHSYLGSGTILCREWGAALPMLPIGNCSAFNLSPQEDVLSQKDYTKAGGNKRKEVRRLSGVDLTFTFHDFSAENFAIGLRSSATVIASGTATDESVVAYKGGYTKLAKIALAITNVEPAGGGTAYTPVTDYELRDGVLFIPSTSTIAAPVAGAANLDVTYTYRNQKKVEALVNSNKDYELMFVGANEAQAGKLLRVHLYKVSAGVLQEMALIGDDFGGGTVNGALQSDSTKGGAGLSEYFTWESED